MSAANPATDNARQTNFARMSVALTGFTTDIINPPFDPLELAETYLRTADQNAGAATVNSLIQQYLSLRGAGLGNQAIADALLDTKTREPGPEAVLARQILALWYLGSWYLYTEKIKMLNSATVVNPNAYVGGLAWKAMQAHPMGYSDFTFGYWVQPPPPLSDFGVDVPSGGEKNA